ncbi:disease resistance protein RPV1-like isoform X1 [Rosa rugosa]|uniref:disease resistance protein RPV1-like isoform X1 n=1 Tax=Rosa rugosa TaxID=74645 RepID=UPI002B4036FE|nr:disease resistance protein RPV1-like isoform X1 [Rosa rugosa]XP_061991610.1 disease resistance protein RPV1-like isoform X1 [Rosa rugosa]
MSTQLDASSSSSPSPYRCTYHAFLSFRGEDTRKGFTDHLYRALELAGIHTFRDDDEIERGANIAAELQRSIQESRVSVVVLSRDYASSRWCLDELAKIMERRRNDDAHVVIPVFYDVDPSHVRKQSGSFAEAFVRHEERFKEEMGKVAEWRRALSDIADLGGMVLGQRYESQFIQDIVEEIRSKLDSKVLNIAPYAIGIDDRVRGINMWLEDGSNDVGVAVIYGMGGIGKTTIAKAAYNLNFHRFQGSSFLADVRETSEQLNGLVRLQRNLLSDLQKGKTKKIYNIDEGIRKIKDAVCCKKVLIVLDDVNHSDQFNAIIGMSRWFFPGSKIILTTRYEHLLKAHEVNTMFKVQELNEHESLELLSWHAFGQAHPIEAYIDLSKPVVKHCGGIPLALQVLGSSLSGRSIDIWQSALQKLCEIPHGEIQKILRISFDSLQDDHDKNLFLHIACFFRGKKKEFSITVLGDLKFYAVIGIQNLVDRCLVKINEDNKLIVHHLLRDMARGIIREESPEDPGKRSRVWHKDAFNILSKRTQGTGTVKGIILDLSMLMQDESSKTLFSGSNSKRHRVDDYDGNCSGRRRLSLFTWQLFSFSSANTTPASDEVDLKIEAFKKMHNLEVLLLNNVHFSQGFEDFPKNLIWLSWRGFSLNSIPASLYLKTLVVLDLRNSSLQCVWKGTKFLPSLKVLNLSHSHGLSATPDISGLPNLERLILKNCRNLIEVDESIGDLEKLVFLNLKDCKNLMKLPTRIKMSSSLQTLILSGCSKLVRHSNMVATNQSLLTASDMKKDDCLSPNLWKSFLSWAVQSRNIIPTSFSVSNLPRSLRSLSLADCNLLEIPGDLSILSSLKYLDLCGNPIQSLPENIRSLSKLETLMLEECTELRTLPELPPSLQSLLASSCKSLKRITNLPNLFKSLDTDFLDCKKLVEVESLFTIKPLTTTDIEMIKDMGLFNFKSIGSYAEVEMINYITNTTKKVPIQVLSECGISSIYLNGNDIPDWFRHRRMGNSVLSIIVPPHLNHRIRGLNACVVYARRPDIGRSAKYQNLFKVSNETKGLMWTYSPITIGIPKENEDMLWLSHWRFGEHDLGGGDEVRVSVEFGSELGYNLNLWTKELGIQLVYEQESSEDGKKHNFLAGDVSVSSSSYQMWTGKYFLCNNLNRAQKTQFKSSQENPSHLDSDKTKSPFLFLFEHDDVSQADH